VDFPEIQRPTIGGGVGFRCFGVGRLVMILPKSDGQGLKHESKTEFERQIMADVVVFGGGVVNFGGKANNQGGMVEPDTMTVTPVPAWVAENVLVNKPSLIRSCEKALPYPSIGKPGGAVLGRLWQDPQYRNAWKLADPTAEDFAIAEQWKALVTSGTFVNPTPQKIAGVAPAQPTAQPAPTAPASGYGSFAANPAASVLTAVPAPSSSPVPPGFDPAAWSAMPPEQRQGILTAMGIAPAAPVVSPAPPGFTQAAWEAMGADTRAGVLAALSIGNGAPAQATPAPASAIW
jgi:hypothetical protein